MEKTLVQKIQEFFMHLIHDLNMFVKEIYLAMSLLASSFLACYTDIKTALLAFVIITFLDTATRIHANAIAKGLRFNPFKGYFWKEIQSGGMREMSQKIFLEYGVYLIISFVIDVLIFHQEVLFEIYNRKLTLPVIALYLFSAIELWSIGENIEDAGGVNLFKKTLQFFPDKFQQIFKKEE